MLQATSNYNDSANAQKKANFSILKYITKPKIEFEYNPAIENSD